MSLPQEPPKVYYKTSISTQVRNKHHTTQNGSKSFPNKKWKTYTQTTTPFIFHKSISKGLCRPFRKFHRKIFAEGCLSNAPINTMFTIMGLWVNKTSKWKWLEICYFCLESIMKGKSGIFTSVNDSANNRRWLKRIKTTLDNQPSAVIKIPYIL